MPQVFPLLALQELRLLVPQVFQPLEPQELRLLVLQVFPLLEPQERRLLVPQVFPLLEPQVLQPLEHFRHSEGRSLPMSVPQHLRWLSSSTLCRW